MALVFLGKTNCSLCGKLLGEKDQITSLPAISDVSHDLYAYFDSAFHQRCFDKWYYKNEAMETLKKDKEKFHQQPLRRSKLKR
ncbi:MAG: hypothetical protein EOO13_09495 [Chitinophagaceae bacterium]|nr:MAG: hypothetical protein EOO13_09495 [Chitinophagaceae bacterium]